MTNEVKTQQPESDQTRLTSTFTKAGTSDAFSLSVHIHRKTSSADLGIHSRYVTQFTKLPH